MGRGKRSRLAAVVLLIASTLAVLAPPPVAAAWPDVPNPCDLTIDTGPVSADLGDACDKAGDAKDAVGGVDLPGAGLPEIDLPDLDLPLPSLPDVPGLPSLSPDDWQAWAEAQLATAPDTAAAIIVVGQAQVLGGADTASACLDVLKVDHPDAFAQAADQLASAKPGLKIASYTLRALVQTPVGAVPGVPQASQTIALLVWVADLPQFQPGSVPAAVTDAQRAACTGILPG